MTSPLTVRETLLCIVRYREARPTAAYLLAIAGLVASTWWQIHREQQFVLTAEIYALFDHDSNPFGLLGLIFPFLQGMHMETFAIMEGEALAFAEYVITAFIVFVALIIGFMAFAASRPADNPLRQVASIFMKRLAVTAGVGMVDVPLLAAGPLGDLADVVSLLPLAGYWIYGLYQSARAFMPRKPLAAAGTSQPPTIVYMQPPMHGQGLMPVPPTYDRQPYQPAPPPYPAE